MSGRKREREAEAAAASSWVVPAWDGLVGQEALVERLQRLHGTGRFPPVLLFTGREGLGKRAVAAAVAALHVCETQAACGRCGECRAVLAGRHPEVFWLERSDGPLLLEDADQLSEHASLNPSSGYSHRIGVLIDADRLGRSAANRLLKTLEEPAERVRFVMTTSRRDLVLPTIRSRAVRWPVVPPAFEETKAFLQTQQTADPKLQDLPEAELDDLVRLAGLAPGRALTLCRKMAEGEGVAYQTLERLWTVSSPEETVRVAAEVAKGAPVADFLGGCEIALNRWYRRVVEEKRPAASGEQARPTPGAVRRRRDILRRAKALAFRGKVPLNAQLAAEGLAGASFLASVSGEARR